MLDDFYIKRTLPDIKDLTPDSQEIFMHFFAEAYGYRGGDNQEVLYLSPWEFMMWWKVRPLPRPAGPMPRCTESEEYEEVAARCNESLRDKGSMVLWCLEPHDDDEDKPRWEPNEKFSAKNMCFYPEDIPGSVDFRRTQTNGSRAGRDGHARSRQ